jgi:hypothetical protein
MIQSMLRRSVPALTLATILFITCTGTAQARTFTPAEQAWSWLRQVWVAGVGGLWDGGAAVRAKEGISSRRVQKVGNGSLYKSEALLLFPPPCTTCANEGPGMDPNGSH